MAWFSGRWTRARGVSSTRWLSSGLGSPAPPERRGVTAKVANPDSRGDRPVDDPGGGAACDIRPRRPRGEAVGRLPEGVAVGLWGPCPKAAVEVGAQLVGAAELEGQEQRLGCVELAAAQQEVEGGGDHVDGLLAGSGAHAADGPGEQRTRPHRAVQPRPPAPRCRGWDQHLHGDVLLGYAEERRRHGKAVPIARLAFQGTDRPEGGEGGGEDLRTLLLRVHRGEGRVRKVHVARTYASQNQRHGRSLSRVPGLWGGGGRRRYNPVI